MPAGKTIWSRGWCREKDSAKEKCSISSRNLERQSIIKSLVKSTKCFFFSPSDHIRPREYRRCITGPRAGNASKCPLADSCQNAASWTRPVPILTRVMIQWVRHFHVFIVFLVHPSRPSLQSWPIQRLDMDTSSAPSQGPPCPLRSSNGNKPGCLGPDKTSRSLRSLFEPRRPS